MLSHQTRRIYCYALRYAAPRETGAIDDVIDKIQTEARNFHVDDVEIFLSEAIQQAQERPTNIEKLERFIKFLQCKLNDLQIVKPNLPPQN